MKHMIHQLKATSLSLSFAWFIVSCSIFNAVLSFAQPSPSAGRAAIMHSKFRKADSGGMANDTNALTTIQYFDGRGNPRQNVGYRQSPTKKDIVMGAVVYDYSMREVRNYLPFPLATGTGGYHSSVQATASSFYNDNVPYQEVLRYDNSSLNQIRETRGAGQAWKTESRTQKGDIQPEFVKFIQVDASGNLIHNGRFYSHRKLKSTVAEDEHGNKTRTVTDAEGKTISIIHPDNLITSYVYDYRDQLAAVIQPQGYDFGSTGITRDSPHWQKYVFGYEYDLRGRIIRKHIPGAGWTEIVYDKADRPVMTQNAAQKILNRWNFVQYDVFGREITYGETAKTTTRDAAQALFNSHTVLHETWADGTGYSAHSFPASLKPLPDEIEKFNFYDTYGFIASEFAFKPVGAFYAPKSSARGLLTGVSKRNSREDGRYYTDTYYYDDLNRHIQSQHTHQLSTGNQHNVIVKNVEYNFANEVTKEHVTYPFTTGTVSTAQHNHYDHAGRLIHIDYGTAASAPLSDRPAPLSEEGNHGVSEPGGKRMYSLGFAWPENGVIPPGANGQTNEAGQASGDGWVSGGGWVSGVEPSRIITYSYDETGRMTLKKFLPGGTFSIGNPDYIYLPPNPSASTENKARKAVILEPGTIINAAVTGSYLAGIDITVSNIPPFSGLQTMNYSWHIRGGLRGINLNPAGNPLPDSLQGDLFSYKLDFESAGQWSGNIGRQSWNHIEGTESVGVRNYTYTYDGLDRLKTSIFSGLTGENYSLHGINYDKNGNILNLQRKGKVNASASGLVDNLTYTYSGNRLLSVTDAVSGNDNTGDFRDIAGSTDYTYWENGALKSDANKGVSLVEHNTFLNKISKITYSKGDWIEFTYDGSGTLIKRQNSNGDYWEYSDKMIFKNGQPYSFAIPEGRAIFEGGQWKQEFEYRDVWNNLRVVFGADGNRLVKKQQSDYDVYGYEFNKNSVSAANYFKYQNQERIEDLGPGGVPLNIDFFKYRPSDPTIGRFWSGIDPLAEKYYYNSPYALQENKFGLGVELEGAELKEFIDWSKEKLNAAWNALPNGISIERNYSVGPQIGFELQTPATSMQAELKLASFDIGQRKLEKRDGKLVESTTLGYTKKTEVEGLKPVYEDIGRGNVENSFGLGLSVGKLGFSKEIGQKQDIRICAGCEGSSNTRRYSKSTASAGFATIEKTKYLDGSGQTTTSLNLLKVDIRAIFGVEIKVGLDYNKKKEDK